jgi:hypothetical protein
MNRIGVSNTDFNAAKWNDQSGASRYEGRWANKSPDITNGDCAYLTISNTEYKWQFGQCEDKMAYVCERKSCPSSKLWLYVHVLYSNLYLTRLAILQ